MERKLGRGKKRAQGKVYFVFCAVGNYPGGKTRIHNLTKRAGGGNSQAGRGGKKARAGRMVFVS